MCVCPSRGGEKEPLLYPAIFIESMRGNTTSERCTRSDEFYDIWVLELFQMFCVLTLKCIYYSNKSSKSKGKMLKGLIPISLPPYLELGHVFLPSMLICGPSYRLSLEVRASDPLKEMLAFSNSDRWDT